MSQVVYSRITLHDNTQVPPTSFDMDMMIMSRSLIPEMKPNASVEIPRFMEHLIDKVDGDESTKS